MTDGAEIPLNPRQRPNAIWVSILLFYFIGSPILAIDNLLHYDAPLDPVGIISAIWLLVILATVVSLAPELPNTVMAYITSFSNDRFVVVKHDRRGRARLCFGCRLLGFTIWSRRIAVDSVEEVELFQGQASGLAGRDMNDWEPLIRYGKEGEKRYFVGPSQARETAEIDMHRIERALRTGTGHG